ncbi:MAG: nucleotide exchange factor GrpE [Muribaculaceae bacterium]|nr:nucleotide exchange factor GrpE [Muribaculaceae bacterium]
MSKNKHTPEEIDNLNAADIAPEIDDVHPESDGADVEDFANEEMHRIEQLQQQLADAQAAVDKEKKEYLFLMADFDNFRKRVVKEKAEILRNGAEKVLAGLLPIVDDFERGLQATENMDDAKAVREGMELIYNKLVKYLADNGVKPIESTGADFDDNLHEAIATLPAPDDDHKGKVLDTVQKGYMINDKVLRHAKVAVGA